jgi:hypothetical protein
MVFGEADVEIRGACHRSTVLASTSKQSPVRTLLAAQPRAGSAQDSSQGSSA